MAQSRPGSSRQLATLKQAALYAATSEKTIRRRIADGSIPAFRFGPRQLRVDLNDIDAALHRVPTAGSAA